MRVTIYAFLVLVAGGSSTAARAASKFERSEAVYPKSLVGIPIRDFKVATGKRKLGATERPTFSHQKHLEAGAECESCHGRANKSIRTTDRLLPAHPDCDSCHDIESARSGKTIDPEAACWYCHMLEPQKPSGANDGKPGSACKHSSDCDDDFACDDDHLCHEVTRAEWPRSNLIFDHQVHVEEQKVGCEVCHFSEVATQDGGYSMQETDLATRAHLPKMETCLPCHDGRRSFTTPDGPVVASAACTTCHVSARKRASSGTKKSITADYLTNFKDTFSDEVPKPVARESLDLGHLQLTFASGSLRPIQGDPFGLDHGPRYELNHGTRAKLDREICLNCHTELSCMQCHDGLQKPLSVHPNDYITLHPVQARADSLACQSCHRFQSFCAACHERVGIGMSADPSLRARNLKVHGDYNTWVNLPGPKHHSIEASRDIKSCVACHREESCLACHGTSKKFGISVRSTDPHPDGFKDICKALASKNDRACLKCHLASELKTLGCE